MAKAVDIEKDGTLIVRTRHYDSVRRVLVERGTSGILYYPDSTDLSDFCDKLWRLAYDRGLQDGLEIAKKLKEANNEKTM